MEVLVDILCLCSLAKDEENLICENYVWRIKFNDELYPQFL
jgi:hypothetical protein